MRRDDGRKDDGERDGTRRNDPSHIDPTRLMDAVDAILLALDDYKIDTRGGTIAPTELLGLPNQPRVLCDYTRWEIEQASAFMTRLGLIEPARARKA